MIIRRYKYNKIQVLQIVFAVLFGQIVNLFNIIININLGNFYIRILLCILSFFITATGVFLTITADIVPVAPDGLTNVISIKIDMEFGKTKIYFDCIVVILSILILIFGGQSLEGIGIGTLLAALLVGKIVFYINKYFKSKVEKVIFL